MPNKTCEIIGKYNMVLYSLIRVNGRDSIRNRPIEFQELRPSTNPEIVNHTLSWMI